MREGNSPPAETKLRHDVEVGVNMSEILHAVKSPWATWRRKIESQARIQWADMTRALDFLELSIDPLHKTLDRLRDFFRGVRALGICVFAPLVVMLPGMPRRALAEGVVQDIKFLSGRAGLPASDVLKYSRILQNHIELASWMGLLLIVVLIYRTYSRAASSISALCLRNLVPFRCAGAIVACALEAGMLPAERVTVEADRTTFTLRASTGPTSSATISMAVRGAARALLRMHRGQRHLSRARRIKIKHHGARVAATLYAAELRIDRSPELARRELAEMLAMISENFSEGKLVDLYPEEKLVEKPARDWERFRSLGCAVAGILVLWWVSRWGLSGSAEAVAEGVAFTAPFVAVYGPEKSAQLVDFFRSAKS